MGNGMTNQVRFFFHWSARCAVGALTMRSSELAAMLPPDLRGRPPALWNCAFARAVLRAVTLTVKSTLASPGAVSRSCGIGGVRRLHARSVMHRFILSLLGLLLTIARSFADENASI